MTSPTRFPITIAAHDNRNDMATFTVVGEPEHIDIFVAADTDRVVSGASVSEGYERTVRIEMIKGVLRVMVYMANDDSPSRMVTVDMENNVEVHDA